MTQTITLPSLDANGNQPVIVKNWLSAQPVGAANVNTGQATAGPAASILVPSRAGGPGVGRCQVTIINETGSDKLIVGKQGVTAATGFSIPAVAGASVTISTTAAIYGFAATPQTISWLETY